MPRFVLVLFFSFCLPRMLVEKSPGDQKTAYILIFPRARPSLVPPCAHVVGNFTEAERDSLLLSQNGLNLNVSGTPVSAGPPNVTDLDGVALGCLSHCRPNTPFLRQMINSVAHELVLNSMHDPVEPNTTLFSSCNGDLTDAKSRFDIRVQELHAALALAPLPPAAALQQRLRALDASSSKKPHVLGRSVIDPPRSHDILYPRHVVYLSLFPRYPELVECQCLEPVAISSHVRWHFRCCSTVTCPLLPFRNELHHHHFILRHFHSTPHLSLCTDVTGSSGSHCIHVTRLARHQCVPSLVSLIPKQVWRHDLRHCRTNKVRRKSIQRRRSFDTNEIRTCWMAPANCFKSFFGGGSRCYSQVREVAWCFFRQDPSMRM